MIDVQTAFKWLKLFRGPTLVTPVTTLRDQIFDKIQKNEFVQAYKLIEYLETSAAVLNDKFDIGDILAEIGLAYYRMGNLQKAEEYWLRARNDYNDCHEGAVVCWILGTVRWQIDTGNKFALNDWKTAIREFRILADEAEQNRLKEQYDWYEERIAELEKCMLEQISIQFP